MTLLEDLQSYQDKRQYPGWIPYRPEMNGQPIVKQLQDSKYLPSGELSQAYIDEAIVKRSLAFLDLELQVKEWILSADVDADIKSFLNRNSTDEDKHDVVLRMLEFYYGGRYIGQDADNLIQGWRSLQVHPLVATYSIEIGVFFSILPLLTIRGDVYAASVSGWIIDDERCHVETALRLLKHLGIKVQRKCGELVYKTVFFICEPLGNLPAHRMAMNAVKRLKTGSDESLQQVSLPYTVAFFEQETKQSIVY